MKAYLLIVTLFFISSHYSFSQKGISSQTKEKLNAIATQDVPARAPGIATAIIQDGRLIYEKYAGYADLTDSLFIDESTRFNIASNGKQFTALAILSLVDDNQIKLSDDIRKWFPVLYPNVKEQITIQSLLNHTSGIRDCYDLLALQGITWWKISLGNGDILQLIEKQEELNFLPDTQYLYSNTNYILLAMLVEKVSEKTFIAFTNSMFDKLNMPNSSFENDHTQIQGELARPYFNFDTWTTRDWTWDVVGDGNIFSTLPDQIQWEKLVQGYGETSFNKKLIAQSQAVLEESKFQNYGFGLEFSEYKGLSYTFHEGATGAWKATVLRFPEKQSSLITLTNTGKSIPSIQTRQMADVLFDLKADETYLVTKPAKTGSFIHEDEILGTYLTHGNFAFTFKKIDNIIYLQRFGRNDVELEREADNIFHQKFDPAFKQEFTVNSNGVVQVTAYYTNHSPYTLTKSSEIDSSFDFKGLDGTYQNAETDVWITLKHIENANYEVIFRDDTTKEGLLISNSKMLVSSYVFEFKENEFFLNGGRIEIVRFVRK
ncbi:serine hydrolase domain-containing protein [Aquiflexum sp.]|uniref:serine hydrolase domain-containing protein n=1 Tax=Aquiflexum sp. TaxID=1872584 RepID=UPI003592F179